MKESFNDAVTDGIKDRFNDPLISSVLIIFAAWNWKILITALDVTQKYSDRIESIDKMSVHVLWPLVSLVVWFVFSSLKINKGFIKGKTLRSFLNGPLFVGKGNLSEVEKRMTDEEYNKRLNELEELRKYQKELSAFFGELSPHVLQSVQYLTNQKIELERIIQNFNRGGSTPASDLLQSCIDLKAWVDEMAVKLDKTKEEILK